MSQEEGESHPLLLKKKQTAPPPTSEDRRLQRARSNDERRSSRHPWDRDVAAVAVAPPRRYHHSRDGSEVRFVEDVVVDGDEDHNTDNNNGSLLAVDVEQAATDVFASVEQRTRRVVPTTARTTTNDSWAAAAAAAAAGEENTPPQPSTATGNTRASASSSNSSSSGKAGSTSNVDHPKQQQQQQEQQQQQQQEEDQEEPPKMKSFVRRVQRMRQAVADSERTLNTNTSDNKGHRRGRSRGHRRDFSSSMAWNIEAIMATNNNHHHHEAKAKHDGSSKGPSSSSSPHSSRDRRHRFGSLKSAESSKLGLFEDPFEDDEEEDEEESEEFLMSDDNVTGDEAGSTVAEYGSMGTEADKVRKKCVDYRVRRRFNRRWSQRLIRTLAAFWSPRRLALLCYENILRTYLVMFGLPCAVMAWICFYSLGDPEPDYLPGPLAMSWWFNFLARLTVTFELARLVQFTFCESMLWLRHMGILPLGPVVTVMAFTSMGWPMTWVGWAILNMVLMHGDDKFSQHWLYWTGLEIYSTKISGSYVLSSGFYLHCLVSMLLVGAFTAIKRTVVSIRFGRRQIAEFRPRLHKILSDVVILTEIGILADETDERSSVSSMVHLKKEVESYVQVGDVHVHQCACDDDSYGDAFLGGGDVAGEPTTGVNPPSGSPTDTAPGPGVSDDGTPHRILLSSASFGEYPIKDLLGNWEEPVDKLQEMEDTPTIEEIINFRRALGFLEDEYPFGVSFGLATDRMECIARAKSVYERLMKLTPKKENLPFKTLCLLATDEHGSVDVAKKKALRRVFELEASDELSMFAFIQSCDDVYKRLRYFRASVSNSSVIDKVLQRMFNNIYFFLMILIILAVLRINPWALLVPITSLIVSISFALGPSVSKYVEGMFFIAVRRPFDLGDRIVIVSAENTTNPSVYANINLYTTTLRHAISNEVSTVHNWSIASSRIVNCNRSPTANIVFSMKVHLSILKDDMFVRFRKELEGYVRKNSRTWCSLLFCRHDEIDSDVEMVTLTVGFQHRHSWQDAARVLLDRSHLVKYAFDTAERLGVHFETPPGRNVLFTGGVLEDGYVKDYKRNLVGRSNVLRHRGVSSSSSSRDQQGDTIPGTSTSKSARSTNTAHVAFDGNAALY